MVTETALGLTLFTLDVLLVVRLVLVARIRAGAITLIQTMGDFEIDRGDYETWERRFSEFDKSEMILQIFDLTKWRAREFFPALYEDAKRFKP